MSLGLGLGIECLSLGIGLGLEVPSLGHGLGLGRLSLDYITVFSVDWQHNDRYGWLVNRLTLMVQRETCFR